MRKQILILLFCLFALSLPVAAQKGFGGNWEWKSRANANKEQSVVWVTITQKDNKFSGNYAFTRLVDGENDGSDSSFVPFIGIINGDTLTIEFNPAAIHGIEENQGSTRYKKIKSPAMATLRLKNGRLEWIQTKGSLNAGDLSIPRRMTLSRSR